MLMRKN